MKYIKKMAKEINVDDAVMCILHDGSVVVRHVTIKEFNEDCGLLVFKLDNGVFIDALPNETKTICELEDSLYIF